jgi:hypothetical protein
MTKIEVKSPCGYGCGKLISVRAFACQDCVGEPQYGGDHADD